MEKHALILLIGINLLTGCIGDNIVCNEPYIRVGNECCLDGNNNKVCGRDETSSTVSTILAISTTTTSTTSSTTTSIYVECSINNDCGDNGTTIVKDYTCHDGDVVRQYITYACRKPNTPESKCVGAEKTETLLWCGKGERCIEGVPYCRYMGAAEIENLIKPPNSQVLKVNDTEYAEYEGYGFKLAYPISQHSRVVGVLFQIKMPNDEVIEKYVNYMERNYVDGLEIGLRGLKILGQEDDQVRVWIIGSN